MKPDILYFGQFPDATVAELNRLYNVHHYLNDAAAGRDSRPTSQRASAALRPKPIAASPARCSTSCRMLEAISVFGVGLDLVDLKAIQERGIPLGNTPDIIGPEVADLAIGMMLASARQIIFADHYARLGRWASKGPIPFGRSVANKTCGVIGLGGIGRAIADRAVAVPHARSLQRDAREEGCALQLTSAMSWSWRGRATT